MHLLPLFLSIPRRINFSQMKFYGQLNEGTYHNLMVREELSGDFAKII
jgi:hypothetical protein